MRNAPMAAVLSAQQGFLANSPIIRRVNSPGLPVLFVAGSDDAQRGRSHEHDVYLDHGVKDLPSESTANFSICFDHKCGLPM